MAFTVTATQSGSSATTGITLLVRVLTNAVETGGATHGSRTTSGSPAPSGSLTPNFSSSWVGFAISADNNTTMSAAAASNTYDYSTNNPGQLWSAAHGHYTGTVTAATPLTYGAGSVPSGQDHANWCAYEVPASGGSIAIDGSSPVGANNTGAAAVTSASFTPPGSCVLVAMVVAGGSGTGTGITITMTDTSGFGLVWTQRAVSLAADNFQPTFIFTATIGGPPPPATGMPAPQMRPGLSRIRHHHGARRQQVRQTFGVFQAPVLDVTAGLATATGTAASPVFKLYIAGLAGGTAGYFADQSGNPRLYFATVPWGMPANAGRWNSGNWQLDFDTYFADIAAQGMTAAEMHPWGHSHTGCNNDIGNTWDSVSPWTTIPTLNSTFWARIDYLLNSALANGVTVFLNLTMQCDMGMDAFSGTGVFNGTSASTLQTVATNIATRYASQPNLVYMFGDDYNNNDDTRMNAVLTGLRAGGYSGPVSIEYYSSGTTSRRDLSGSPTGTAFPWGGSNAGFNWCYYYMQTYFAVEQAYKENSQVPVVWGDGTYVGGGAGEPADNHIMRNMVWWSLASGARGVSMGSEVIHPWPSGIFTVAVDGITTNAWYNTSALHVYTAFTSLTGWQNLIPDTANSLVTAGRGTRAAYSNQFWQSSNIGTDDYVAASVTPDKSLAVIYCAVAMSITIDQTKIATGYTAMWVDPANGATQSATTGTTYASSGLGNNSAGNADWVLVLQGPPGTSASAGLATGTGTGQQPAGHNAQLASGTGTAQTVADIAIAVTAGLATGTGTAQQPAGHNTGLATGTGTAPQAGGQNAQLASGTGTAQTVADIAITANAGLASGTGPALQAGGQNAQLASGTGTAPQAGGQNAQLASATGSAPDATVTTSGSANVPAGLAAATGLALQAGGQNAGLAAAAGTAQTVADIAITANAGLAAATGPALQAGGHNAQLASGTGTAQAAQAAAAANTGLAAATGPALQAGGQNAQLASGTGTAQQPSVTTSGTANAPAGLASATGLALQAGGQNAQLAAGTGTAQQPLAAVAVAGTGLATATGLALQAGGQNAQPASGTGTAQQPTVTTSGTANAPAGLAAATGTAPASGMAQAGLATSTGTAPQAGGQNAQLASGAGTAQQALAAAAANAILASGTGTAQQLAGHNAQLASGTGTAPQVTPATGANAGLAAAAGTASQAQAGPQAALASGTGTAQQPAGHIAQLAVGTGTAPQPLAVVAVNAPAQLAAGTGTARAPALALATLAAAQAATALAAALQPAVQAAATVVKGHVAVTLADTAGTTGTVTRPAATSAGVTEAAGSTAGVS